MTWGLEVGGLEKLLVELARCANRQNVALRFVSLGGRGDLADEIESHGWPVLALDEPGGVRPGLVPQLAGLFRRWRTEVVHTHNTKALVYGAPAARLAGARLLVHTWHGRNMQPSRREEQLFHLFAKLPDWIVTVSEDARQQLVRQGIAAARLRVILNGIDTTRFACCGPVREGPLVAVARLRPEKDLATLLHALALVRREQPSSRLEIAGDGPCEADLRRLTAELGLQDAVVFHGAVRDVPALLARASLFVLPSLTEGISLTLLEAAARGLPIVATRVGGNPEVVQDGVTGRLVPPATPLALAEALRAVQGDFATAQRMGIAGRERVEGLFDVRRMTAAYEQLYMTAVPRRGAALPLRPRILTNQRRLCQPPVTEQLDGHYLDLERASILGAARAWLDSLRCDAIVVDQAARSLAVLCLLRLLLPFCKPPLFSVDLVLAPRGNSWSARLKAACKRLLLRQVDRFLMHMQYLPALQKLYGIERQRFRYVPFKVNALDLLLSQASSDGRDVFTGGRSRRDYRTFCAAMAELPLPGRIVTPKPAENAEHGTVLDGLQPPANVQLVHDDGSLAAWIAAIAAAKLVVFCIAPETISPSGVSAYLLAMALKKCVIISDCPATRGILHHEQTAILVPMCDAVALRAAIERAWYDDAYRERVAAGGQAYALALGGEETLMRNITQAVLEHLAK